MSEKPPVGTVGWFDLTVEHADEIRDFYADVIGWKAEPVPMGDYEDYSMNAPASGDATAGVCHARGGNANIPPVWMIYINVENLDESLARCLKRGGKAIAEIRSMDSIGRFCAIQDPAGAVLTLFEPA